MSLSKLFELHDGEKTFLWLKAFFLFFIAGFLIYGRTLSFDFVHDDLVTIKNSTVSKPDLSLSRLFQVSTADGMVPYYRPFLEAFFQIEVFLFGNQNPLLYHLLNILLHIINSLLVFFLIKYFGWGERFAFAVAALFLTHPVQTEAVAAIAGVTNLLYSFFCLAGFILYIQSAGEAGKFKNLLLYIVALFLFLLALFAKEPAIVLPILIILYEIFVNHGDKMPTGLKAVRFSGFLLFAAWYLLFRKLMLGSVATDLFGNIGEFWLRILAIPHSLVGYFQVIFFPVNLHYFRNVDILRPFIPYAAVLLVIVSGAVLVISRLPLAIRKVSIFGLGWFFVALLPTLNILPLIIEYSYIYNSEHFLYFPLLGAVIFFVKSLEYMYSKIFKEKALKYFSGTLILLICLLSAAAFKQTAYWKNNIGLFHRTLAFEPQLGRIRIVLARSYYLKGDIQRAIEEYLKGLHIMEGYAHKAGNPAALKFYLSFIKEVHFDLAHCYESQNDFTAAIREYKKALLVDKRDAIVYNNTGVAYLRLNDFKEAKGYFETALALDRRNVLAMNNLAVCLIQEGNFGKARILLEEALHIDPRFAPAQSSLKQLLKDAHGG